MSTTTANRVSRRMRDSKEHIDKNLLAHRKNNVVDLRALLLSLLDTRESPREKMKQLFQLLAKDPESVFTFIEFNGLRAMNEWLRRGLAENDSQFIQSVLHALAHKSMISKITFDHLVASNIHKTVFQIKKRTNNLTASTLVEKWAKLNEAQKKLKKPQRQTRIRFSDPVATEKSFSLNDPPQLISFDADAKRRNYMRPTLSWMQPQLWIIPRNDDEDDDGDSKMDSPLESQDELQETIRHMTTREVFCHKQEILPSPNDLSPKDFVFSQPKEIRLHIEGVEEPPLQSSFPVPAPRPKLPVMHFEGLSPPPNGVYNNGVSENGYDVPSAALVPQRRAYSRNTQRDHYVDGPPIKKRRIDEPMNFSPMRSSPMRSSPMTASPMRNSPSRFHNGPSEHSNGRVSRFGPPLESFEHPQPMDEQQQQQNGQRELVDLQQYDERAPDDLRGDLLRKQPRRPGMSKQEIRDMQRKTICRYYNSPSGCMRGEKCYYRHVLI